MDDIIFDADFHTASFRVPLGYVAALERVAGLAHADAVAAYDACASSDTYVDFLVREACRANADGHHAFGSHADMSSVALSRGWTEMRGGAVSVAVDPAFADVDVSRHVADATFDDLMSVYCGVRTSQFGDLCLIHYDLLGCFANAYCPDGVRLWTQYDGVLAECRGVVIDVRRMEVASVPYYKFRNMDEDDAYAEPVVRDAIRRTRHVAFTEKLDGSLIQLRCLPGHGLPGDILLTTSNTVGDYGNRHISAVWRYLGSGAGDPIRAMVEANPGLTFMFEWIHPDVDPHVVVYPAYDWGLWLTGARRVSDGAMVWRGSLVGLANEFGVSVTPSYDCSLDDVQRMRRTMSGSEHEGFVAYIGGWLVKLKNEDFLAINRLVKSVASFNTVIRAVHQGTIDDMMPQVPDEYRETLDGTVRRIVTFEERAHAAAESMAERVPDGPRREQVAWVRGLGLPKRWFGLVLGALDGRLDDWISVSGSEQSPSYPTERKFAAMEDELREVEGIVASLG